MNVKKYSIILYSVCSFCLLLLLTVSSQLPRELATSPNVDLFFDGLLIIGIISACFLWLLVLQNRKLFCRKVMLKLSLILFGYIGFHFFLVLINNLTNSEFVFNQEFVKGNLLGNQQIFFFTIILFFLALSKIFEKQEERLGAVLPSYQLSEKGICIYFLLFLLFLDDFTTRAVWKIGFGPINSNGVFQLVQNQAESTVFSLTDLVRLLGNLSIVFVLLLCISYFVLSGFEQLFWHKTEHGFSLAFVTSLVLAFVFHYFIQAGITIHVSVPFQGFQIAGATAFQVLLLTGFFLLVFLIVNRYVLATGIILLVFSLFSFANSMKYTMRMEPVYISDLSWIREPLALLSFVSTSVVIPALFVVLIFLSLLIFLSRKFFKGALMNWKVRLLTFVVSVGFFSLIAQNFQTFTAPSEQISIPIITRFIRVANGDVLWQGLPFTAATKSLSFVWMRQAFGLVMDTPNDYSKEKVEEVVEKYTKKAQEINQNRSDEIKDQTLIYLLSESLSNPNRLGGITLSQNPLKNIDEAIDSSTGGLLYTNAYGGGTANIETQTLLGLPMELFNDNVSIINSDVLPRMSVLPSISDFFEEKIFLHPANATSYSRNIVYQRLGFDHIFALSGTSEQDTLQNQARLGPFVSDEQVYKDILEKLKEDQPQFFSVLTMQNHSPFNQSIETSDIQAEGAGFTAEQNMILKNYTERIEASDIATGKFLEELKKVDKKVTLVFYGDHLPPRVFPNREEAFGHSPLAQFETDYFIWSNIGKQKIQRVNANAISFTPQVLELTESKVSPYYALLTEIFLEVPAQFNSPIGSSVELNEEQKEIINDLRIIQYDLTSGQHYLKKGSPFFKIQS